MELNQGLIYTNDNCIGCNRCISGCPVIGANHSKIEGGCNRIYVDGEKCIHCGHCIETCKHGARDYRDDTDRFLEDLEAGVPISLAYAPAAAVNFSHKMGNILGYLKAKGVNHIYNVSYGADITTWAYLKYIKENQFKGGIAQPCPAIVNYIEKYLPELIPYLMPIQSPLVCSAIYIHKYLGDTSRIAFLSPCIAKKDEIESPNTGGQVSYNVTIAHLLKKINDMDIDGYLAYEEQPLAGLGAIYSMSGGLKINMEQFLGYGELIRQIGGESQVYTYLEEYSGRIENKKRLPYLVDPLNCSQGCNFGTATLSKLVHDDDILFSLQEKKNRRIEPGTNDPFERGASYEERKRRLNERFSDLELKDFIRVYDEDAAIKQKHISLEEYDRIFIKMHKKTPEAREINCSSCGFDSCKKMVEAIYCGYNYKENCVHYMKDENLRMYYTDSASGIPNVNAFSGFIQTLIEKKEASSYAAVNFNIKNFKLVNQIYGSAEGDRALVEFARQVHDQVQEDELAARVGEDTFVAVVRKERLDSYLEFLSGVVLPLKSRDGAPEEYKVSSRVGVYLINGDETVSGKIMNRAANACSMTRKDKSIDVVYFDEEEDLKVIRSGEVAQLLKPALQKQEFVVYYQPKVQMATRQLIGAEALVRWKHNGRIIMPMEFIPISEETGLVCDIDFFVLDTVCAQIKAWIEKKLEVVRVSVNFSKLHFVNPGVEEKVIEIIDRWGIPKEYLEIEFTETAYAEEFENLSKTISKLKEFGISTSIDDFGTGYSSLNLLQEIQFDALKLDRSFLGESFVDQRNRTVISHIVNMAKALDMEIISEGVEREEEVEFLKGLSDDIIAQGYLFDRPMTCEEFEIRLRKKYY